MSWKNPFSRIPTAFSSELLYFSFLAISALRKMRGMSQDQLAEKANISRSHLSAIEAPGMIRAFSMEAFFNIADALDIAPADLINASLFPDSVIKKN